MTRAQLASTVDELVARLDPRAQAGRAVESGRQLWTDATERRRRPGRAQEGADRSWAASSAGVAALLALIVAANRRSSALDSAAHCRAALRRDASEL